MKRRRNLSARRSGLWIARQLAYDPRSLWYRPMPHTADITAVVAQIESMFTAYGHESYGENCTQLQHAQQCGTLALQRGLGEELALAAFLHDIGHFIARRRAIDEVDAYGYARHNELGADFLQAHGFSDRIVEVVREHVRAKRYLCAVSQGYIEKLSDASRVTLEQQGGPMSPAEAASYRRHPNLADIIQLRQLDDTGKLPDMPCPPLSFWLRLAREQLEAAATSSDRDPGPCGFNRASA
jgi:uncharacterized domain HDIG